MVQRLQTGKGSVIARRGIPCESGGGTTHLVMKQIQKGELYEHLGGFLKSKGIELTEGSYSRKLEQSCGLMTEAINLSQQGLERAKNEIDEKLDRLRQVIHEKTAPKPPSPEPEAACAPNPPAEDPAAEAEKPTKKAGGSEPKRAPKKNATTPKRKRKAA